MKERVAARVWHVMCDKLLRIAIPMLAIISWLIFGPPHRVGSASRAELTSNATVQPS